MTARPDPAPRQPRPAYERLEGALSLACESLGGGRYLVTGGREPHYVDVPVPECDCPDWAFRSEGRLCKHLVACQLREGVPAAVEALGRYVDELCPLLGPGLRGERPTSWLRADPELDFTLYRFPGKWCLVGGLGERGILYARWPSGFDVYRGPGTLDVLPSRVRSLLPILFPELGRR